MIKIELMHYFGHIFDRELVCFEQLFTWIYYFLFYGEIIECTMLFDMAWGEHPSSVDRFSENVF